MTCSHSREYRRKVNRILSELDLKSICGLILHHKKILQITLTRCIRTDWPNMFDCILGIFQNPLSLGLGIPANTKVTKLCLNGGPRTTHDANIFHWPLEHTAQKSCPQVIKARLPTWLEIQWSKNVWMVTCRSLQYYSIIPNIHKNTNCLDCVS